MSFSHIDKKNRPMMVDISQKETTQRRATAKATMFLGKKVISQLSGDELMTKKGAVFQTSTVAGIQAVKKTSALIPMCHPLLINSVKIDIEILDQENIAVICTVSVQGATGVEMEALTGASVTCLTVYDMCKSISQKMVIKELKLLEKTGGKSDIKND